MKLRLSSIFGLAGLLFLAATSLRGQDIAAGTRGGRIQAGAGVLILKNDYTDRVAKGLSLWGDYDFLNRFHLDLGVEAEAHFGGIITPDDIGENSYLIGPRISYHKRKFNTYAKIMIGRATITNQNTNRASSYNVIPAFGGGLEYKVSRKLNIRAFDVELQQWPDFEPNTLSPLAMSFGLMYVIR